MLTGSIFVNLGLSFCCGVVLVLSLVLPDVLNYFLDGLGDDYFAVGLRGVFF